MKKVIIVTGGSKGIGHATLAHFIRKDFKVINISRKQASLDGCINIQADLSNALFKSAIEKELTGHIKGVDQVVLVHNACMYVSDTIESIEAQNFAQSLHVNVVAPMILNQMVLPFCKKGSSILYIGSTLSEKAVSGAASYAISKHASVGMMRTTCQDLAGKDIHTACICPGFTDTDMLRSHVGNDQCILSQIASSTGYNRLIAPEEIAQTIDFCAHHPVVNGSILHANLGQIES